KKQKAHVLSLIATLEASIARRQGNIARLERENAERRVRIKELEVSIAKGFVALAAAFSELESETEHVLRLVSPGVEMREQLKARGKEFVKEVVVKENDILQLVHENVKENIENDVENPADVDIKELIHEHL